MCIFVAFLLSAVIFEKEDISFCSLLFLFLLFLQLLFFPLTVYADVDEC